MYFIGALLIVLVSSSSGSDAPADKSSVCLRRNEYLKVDGECDSYVECKEYVAVQMSCPDGLHYDPSVQWPGYPCGYPSDVPCQGRGTPQEAEPTQDCPHQYGFYQSSSAAPNDCGQYRMCIAGKAVEMMCPSGLAFNPSTSRCDWPSNVPSCKVDDFFGFTCPAASFDESGNPIVSNHSYDGNCYAFYSCESGIPRLLSCDSGLAFDATSGRCEDEDNVPCASSPAVPAASQDAAVSQAAPTAQASPAPPS